MQVVFSSLLEALLFILLLGVLPYARAQSNINDELALVQGAARTDVKDVANNSGAFDAAGKGMLVELPPYFHGSRALFYESLLPENVNLATERMMWKGSPEGVHVVEQHDQALRWWLRSAMSNADAHRAPEIKRRLLVHVDSHEDIGVDTWDDVPPGAAVMGRAALAQFMSRSSDIGSFIAAAAVAGLVSDVVWLRSDFRHSIYNGPSPGRYIVGFFLDDEGKTICQQIIGQDIALTQEGKRRDKMLNIAVDDFNTCEGKNMRNVRNPFATFNLLVTSLPHFQQDLDQFLANDSLIPISEWLLDVDEDYFATHIPGWHNVVDFLGADFKTEHLLRIRKVLSQLHAACGDDDDTKLVKMVQKLPRQKKGQWKAWKKLECRLKKELKQELMHVTHNLSKHQRTVWDLGFRNLYENKYISGDAFSIFDKDGRTSMPHGLPSTTEIAHTFSLLEGSLQHVVQRLGRPQALTACRSILNGYLPYKLWPFIEQHLQDTLRRALGDPELRMVPDAANPPTALFSSV